MNNIILNIPMYPSAILSHITHHTSATNQKNNVLEQLLLMHEYSDYDAILGTMRFYLEQKPTTAYALVAYQHRTCAHALVLL